MSILDIKAAISKLRADQTAKLTEWFERYQEQVWDNQIKGDLESGRLDLVLNEVEKEYEAGLAEPL